MPHLFEFMDQEWVPSSLRGALRDILECVCSPPFRSYYRWVAYEVFRSAEQGGCNTVVELGAGTAPLTRLMARTDPTGKLRFIVCDSNPDAAVYQELERLYGGVVRARYDPVDFSLHQEWPRGTLLFLSATLHHIPPSARSRVLSALAGSAERILIFEPLRKTILSMLFVLPAILPALLLPVWFFPRPGKVRRFVWCWLIPVAPLLFCWDGVISCFRQWTEREWKSELEKLPAGAWRTAVQSSTFCQMISLTRDPAKSPHAVTELAGSTTQPPQ